MQNPRKMTEMVIPEIRVERVPLQSNTPPAEISEKGTEYLLPIEASQNGTEQSVEESGLAGLLREQAVDVEGLDIWPLKRLLRLFTRNRVLNELRAFRVPNAESFVDLISSDGTELGVEPPYIRIFAILLLMGKSEMIGNFVHEKVSDKSLPFYRYNEIPNAKRNASLFLKDKDTPIPLLQKWSSADRQYFEQTQWQLLVPYLELNRDDTVREYEWHEKHTLPWSTSTVGESQSSIPSTATGAYGRVYCVEIPPDCHNFRNALQTIKLDGNVFAIKELLRRDFNNEAQFRRELEHLKRFNGRVDKHLVTLLTSITKRTTGPEKLYYFVFPFARCALDEYWEVSENRKWDIPTIRWVSRQLSGIMGAMDTIHMPKHLHASTEGRKYAMHSDIKPDNILWFNSHGDDKGILVISDFGSAAIHGDKSRSNIPNDKIPVVPGYRPPECDIQGGLISRRYDIWTLGCLFLEILTWLMGGQEYLRVFKKERMKTVYITGAKRDMFYTVKKLEGENTGNSRAIHLRIGGHTDQPPTEKEWYALEVKQEVKEWINRLHTDRRCSNFIHDVLNCIEKEMLVILYQGDGESSRSDRSTSSKLKVDFQAWAERCDKDNDYCIQGNPTRPGLVQAPIAVLAPLNEEAENHVKLNKDRLQGHDPIREGGRTKSSVLWETLPKEG